MNDWSDRQQKERARRKAVEPSGSPSSMALMLPSSTMKCVKEAEASGLFDSNTLCVCVERNLAIFNKMVQTAKTVKSKIVPIHSDLHCVNLDGNFDYAFFDFNGALTEDVADWLDHNFVKHIAPGANLVFTFEYACRNNSFIPELHEFTVQPCMRKYLRETSIRYCGVADETIAMYLLLFRLIFHRYDFVVDTPIKYRDTQPMLMFSLKDFQPGSSGLPPEARHHFELFMNQRFASRRTNMSRQNAANKAWETRRANAEKLSNAAKKAWETRRNNAIIKRRSEIAKKAWATRRLRNNDI